MPLTRLASVPQIYRNVVRWREILGILSKYGLADWLSRIDLDIAKGLLKSPLGEELARLSHEARIRLALIELGVTGIKLGQVLSTRPDVVGLELATELERLQADTPGTSWEQVETIVTTELGAPIDELFAAFDHEPTASASIGQVHRARLLDGTPVVVKVRHPGVAEQADVDLEILSGLAHLVQGVEELQNYQPRSIVAELEATLSRELDFRREEMSLVEFGELFADHPTLDIPEPYPKLSTRRVLTMEYLDGIKLSERERLKRSGLELEAIASRGAEIYLEMIFEHGIYHADPHPGNILLLPGNRIGLIDFGMIGRLDERLQEDIESMLIAVAQGDGVLLTSILARVGRLPPDLDRATLSLDVGDFVSRYGRLPMEAFDLTGALRDMTELVRRYHITLPARLAMLIKTLILLEGSARRLSPSFNLLELVESFHQKAILRRLSPKRQVRKLRRLEAELREILDVLPRGLMDIVEQLRDGSFEVHLDHRGLEPSVNRLVLGLLASALFVGSSLLLAMAVPPVIRGMSVLGAAGAVLSLFLGLRLTRAIARSGHLDSRRADSRKRRSG